jgi:hypothetical protein
MSAISPSGVTTLSMYDNNYQGASWYDNNTTKRTTSLVQRRVVQNNEYDDRRQSDDSDDEGENRQGVHYGRDTFDYQEALHKPGTVEHNKFKQMTIYDPKKGQKLNMLPSNVRGPNVTGLEDDIAKPV